MDEGIRARLGLPAGSDPGKARNDLRTFGIGLAVLLSVLAGLAWRKASPAAPYELALAAICASIAWLRPLALDRIYKPWMKAAGVIGKANTYVVVALVYYLVLTPYGVAARLFGEDLLDEKLRDRDSYWHSRGALPEPESYHHQF
jgi:hypothetical protein